MYPEPLADTEYAALLDVVETADFTHGGVVLLGNAGKGIA